jgi:anti-sigma factor RsiW
MDSCPSRESLTAFLTGKLPAEQEEPINRHLETCPICEAHAQQIEQQPDVLIDALRQPTTIIDPGAPKRPEPRPPDAATLRLERYQIVREIGRGGMGVVYEAYQHRLKRPVAIKMT